MNKTNYFLCLLIIVLSPLLFASVYTFAYTLIFVGVIITGLYSLGASIRKNSVTGIWQFQGQYNPLIPLFFIFIVYLIIQMIPVPGSILTYISLLAKVIGQKSLPAAALQGAPIPDLWHALAPYIYPVRMSLVRWIVYGIFLWSFLLALNSRKRIELAIIVILAAGCFEALYGIIQTYSGYEHIWWYKKNAHVGFPSGTYSNRNHFAGFMEMGIILSIAYAVFLFHKHTKRQSTKKSRPPGIKKIILHFFSSKQLYTKIFLVVFSGVVMGVGLILSASRSGIISLACALMIMSFFYIFTKKYRRQGLYVLIPFLLLTAVYSIFAGIDIPVDRFRLFDSDFLNRAVMADKTLHIFDDYKLFGIGVGNFQYLYPKYQDVYHQGYFINYAHNDWAQFLAEAGLVGFILLLAGLGCYVVNIWKKWKASPNAFAVCLGIAPVITSISLAIHSLSDFNLHIPANMILLIAVIAIGYKSFYVEKDETDQGLTFVPIKTRTILIIAFFTTMTLWSGTWVVRHGIGEVYCNTIQTPPLKLNQHPDVSLVQEAINWDGGNAAYKFKLATALMSDRGKIGDNTSAQAIDDSNRIIKALEEAIRLNPFKAEYHIRLGWEYSYLWYRPDYYSKWLSAGELCMERASYFNGVGAENPHLHIDMGKFWTMRSKTLEYDPIRQDIAWLKACWHYKKALGLNGSKFVQDEITGYIRQFYSDEKYIKEATG